MNHFKRGLLILLTLVLTFTTVFVTTPVEASAKNTSQYLLCTMGTRYSYTEKIVVYKDATNLYAGDFIYVYKCKGATDTYISRLSSIKSGASYKSSDTKVVKINSKTGKMSAKKAGTAIITVKYKGAKTSFRIVVLNKSKFFKELTTLKAEYTKDYANTCSKEAKVFLNEVGKNTTIDTTNRYKLLSATKRHHVDSGYTSTTLEDDPEADIYYVYSPTATHAYTVYNNITVYGYRRNPFDDLSEKHFRIKSIKGKGNIITITLKDKVTLNMIYGANYKYSWDSEVKESNTYSFPIVIQNTTTKHMYSGVGTINRGSTKMTIALNTHTLVKGDTYQLLSRTNTTSYYSTLGTWLDKKDTFKAN